VSLRALLRVASLTCLICASATAATAQTTYRVTSSQATIWNSDFRTAAATVRVGTLLTVIERRDDWYEVITPDSSRTNRRTGFIDGDVFRLGTPDTIAITPVVLKTGWQFGRSGRDGAMTPYVGGGIGTVFYRENSNFVDASANVSRRFTSYHALGGVEFRHEW